MNSERITDARAVELLALLADYSIDWRDRGEPLEALHSLTVAELAGDLIDSVPRVDLAIAGLELGLLGADSITGPAAPRPPVDPLE